MMKMKVLNATWYSPTNGTGAIIGIVQVQVDDEVKWYIGFGQGRDERADIQSIIRHGSRFYPEIFKRFLRG